MLEQIEERVVPIRVVPPLTPSDGDDNIDLIGGSAAPE